MRAASSSDSVAVERQLDAVLDREARVAPSVLHRVHDVARAPLRAQLVVDREVERDRVRAFALDAEALGRAHDQLHVLGVQRVIAATDGDAELAAVAHRRRDARRV